MMEADEVRTGVKKQRIVITKHKAIDESHMPSQLQLRNTKNTAESITSAYSSDHLVNLNLNLSGRQAKINSFKLGGSAEPKK